MTEAITENSYEPWGVESSPFAIEYAPAVMEEIRQIVVHAFYLVPRGGVEVGGVLFGRYEQNRVRILKFRPIECSHASGPSFILSDSDLAGLQLLLRGFQNAPELAGLEPVGWYHSHTRSHICLTEADLELYNQFFPEPWQVALVLRPEIAKPVRAGFFFRHGDGSVQTGSSCHEFTLSPLPLSLESPAIEEDPGRHVRAPLEDSSSQQPAPVSISSPLARPAPPPESSQGRRGWFVAAIAVMLGLGGSAFVTKGYWLSYLQPARLSADLRVMDENGHLLISWDRESSAILRARGGVLEISDGTAKSVIDLDVAKLQHGGCSYVRRSEKVDIRMKLEESSGKAVEEMTTFFGLPVKREPSPEELEAKRERDALAREAEQMRYDLRVQSYRRRKLEEAIRDLREELQLERQLNKTSAPPPP